MMWGGPGTWHGSCKCVYSQLTIIIEEGGVTFFTSHVFLLSHLIKCKARSDTVNKFAHHVLPVCLRQLHAQRLRPRE